MSSYYVLDCHTLSAYNFPELRDRFHGWWDFEISDEVRGKMWTTGMLLDPRREWEDERPPKEPIEIRTKPKKVGPRDVRQYRELTWVDIPLMSRRLVSVLKKAGVHNLQTFETVLTTFQGENPPPKDFYLAVNIIGLLKAADLTKSKIPPHNEDELLSMDFDSLAIDDQKALGYRMFRLAENTSAVLVHERVKKQVEDAGINTLTWIPPELWAG